MAYQYSDDVLGYQKKMQELENSRPNPYQSKYGSQMGDLMNKIINRQPFSYDFNADPLYQNYKDQYVKLGNEAAMNAAAASSALTGGYGNSYATTAAAQANQQYLTQLNGVIPELYNAAMSKYKMDTEDLYNKYGLYKDADDTDYGRYRDAYGDWQNERGYYNDKFNNERNWDFSLYQYNNPKRSGSGGGSPSNTPKDTPSSSWTDGDIVNFFASVIMNGNKELTKQEKIKALKDAGVSADKIAECYRYVFKDRQVKGDDPKTGSGNTTKTPYAINYDVDKRFKA